MGVAVVPIDAGTNARVLCAEAEFAEAASSGVEVGDAAKVATDAAAWIGAAPDAGEIHEADGHDRYAAQVQLRGRFILRAGRGLLGRDGGHAARARGAAATRDNGRQAGDIA